MADKFQEIPRTYLLDKTEFETKYLTPGKPVIITGEIEHLPARKWDLDYLVGQVGDNKVYVRANTSSHDYKVGKKYNIRETTFGEYVSDLKANNHRAKTSYLAVQNIKKALPQIHADFEVPKYVGKMHGGPYLWIAHEGHYEYCHFDPDDGLLVMIAGQKEVRLYGGDPEPMYPNDLGSKGRTVQSQVNCDDPDLESHPKFREVTCHHCTLSPGEMLYIPAFWWHQVTSTAQAISVNMFWGDAGTNTYLTKVMESRWPAFSHWLLNIIEQNRHLPSFTKVLGRLPESLFHFLLNQWHDEASQEQLDLLVNHVMDYLGISELPEEKNTGRNPTALLIRGLLWRLFLHHMSSYKIKQSNPRCVISGSVLSDATKPAVECQFNDDEKVIFKAENLSALEMVQHFNRICKEKMPKT